MKKRPRESREVRAWMARKGIRAKDLAAEIGVKESSGFVSHFINGETSSQTMRQIFIDKGCPVRLMDGLDAMRTRMRKKVNR